MKRTKNTTIKRITSMLLSAVMMISSVQSVFAVTYESFTDFPTGWSRPAMEAAVNNDLLVGFENNGIRPQSNLTRAEMAAIMSRAFGAITMADISVYKDVPYDAWYFESVAKAVQMGAMTGKSATEMCPECNITREEAFSVIGRILALSDEDTSVLSKFHDAANVSSWAAKNIAALVRRGYVSGDTYGNLNPKANITREEFAQVMYTTIKRYIKQAGGYSEDMQGIVVVRTGNVNLSNMTVTGDLVIGDGAMKNAVQLTNVNVNGRFLTRGGTMTLKNTTVSEGVVVLNPNGITKFNNYRTEPVFDGIIEHTIAAFLSGASIQTGGSSGSDVAVKHYVTFKLDEDDTEAYAKIRVSRGNKIGSDMPADPELLGYTFEGWFDQNGNEVTADTRVSKALNVTARFSATNYPIEYRNDDETSFSYFVDGYTPVATYNIETPYVLPDADDVYRLGYAFNGWVDADGNPVTTVEVTEATTDAGLVLYADFEVINYPIEYRNDDETSFSYFADGYTPVATYNIETPYVLPDADDVDKLGYSFIGWVDANGTPVTTVEVTDATTDAGLVLYADFEVIDYPIEYRNDNETPFSYFVDGYTPVATYNIETPYVLPDADDVYRLGYAFNGWVDANETPVTTVEVTEATTDAGLVLYADFEAVTYTLRLNAEFKDGSTYKDISYTIETLDSITLPGENMLVIPDGKESLLGWYLGDTKIDALDESFITGTPNTPVVLVPRFSDAGTTPSTPPTEPPTNTYEVVFLLSPETTDACARFDITDGETIGSHMPADLVKRGYTFAGWFDGATEITEDTIVTGPITAIAKFTLNEYTIRFVADFEDGTAYKDVTYTILNYDTVAFPTQDDLIIPAGKENLLGWYNANGELVTFLDDSYITDDPSVIIELTPKFSDIIDPGEETITVRFYEGYGELEEYVPEWDRILVLNADGEASIKPEEIPAHGIRTKVFEKKKYMPTNYPDYDGVYRVTPTFWYEKDGKLVSFNSDVVLTEDTDVYLMYQEFAFNASLTGLPPVALSTKYNEDMRIVDSAKVLGHSAVSWLTLAKNYPKYTDLVDLGIDKLVDLNIMDAERNLKMLYLPVKISTFTTADIANGMVKSRLREMIANPEGLDELLEIADLETLLTYIDKDQVVADLNDAEIAALMKAEANRTLVSNFIITDLQKGNESVLMETVLSYVSTMLATDGALRTELAEDLKVKLAGTDDSAKKLRKMVLKSNSLTVLLSNDKIEAKIVDMILDTDSGLIDVILADETLAKKLIEEVSHYPKFVDEIVKTEQFKKYILPLIQVGGAEYHNVTEAILNSATAKREILDAVEASADFKALVKNNAAVRTEILASITVDYAIDIDDVVKFVFEIDGATDYSGVVNTAAIDAYFDTLPGFDVAVTMYGSRKAAKNALYADESVRSTVKAHIVNDYGDDIDQHVADYIANNKETILNTFIDNKAALDPAILTTIETKMIDFVKRYVDKDTTLNSNIAAVIEADILTYISNMITGPVPTEPELAAVKTRLDADIEEFIDNAHNNPQIVTVIKNFIDHHHDADMAALVDTVYDDFAQTIATYIKGLSDTSDNYIAIDGTLANAASTIDTAVLADIIKENSANADILAILREYLADEGNENDILGYINSFIGTIDEAFVRANRPLINDLIASLDLEEIIGSDSDTVLALIKEHINGLTPEGKTALADSIYNTISQTEEYKTLIEHMFEMDEIVVTPTDIPFVKAISNAIRDLSIDEAIDFTHNAYIEKIVNLLGEDFISDRFDETKNHYCDGLDEVIKKIESGRSNYETYTTALTFRVDPVADVLKKLYDKALPIAMDKVQVVYDRIGYNEYIDYLVNHNVMERLLAGDGIVDGDFIGYQIKDEAEYAKYAMELFIAIDDAICLYGDELTDEEIRDIYDAVFARAQNVHARLNAILEEYMATGELPDKADQLIKKVQKINDLFLKVEPKLRELIEKYLNHSINDKIEDGTIAENEKIFTALDILLGRDDPVFTIDVVYEIFYKYDDKVQAKLKELVDSGKLEKAIDKAIEKAKENDRISGKLDAAKFEKIEKLADKLYAILVNVAENGIDEYRVDTDGMPTIIDKYELKLGENVFSITRSLQY